MKPIALPALALIVFAAAAAAEKYRPFIDNEAPLREGIVDPEPWKEGKSALPPYPEDADLLEFQVDQVDTPFRYYIDGRNLSIGDDGVVRYTLVIKSRSGAANVSHEGVRCDEEQYRVYAYGARGSFHPLKVEQWENLARNDYERYRHDLRNAYLCDLNKHLPYEVGEMLHHLKEGAPKNRDVSNYY